MTELAKSFEPAAIEAHWGPLWERKRRLRADARPGQALVLHPAAAAQRDRHAAHGARVPAHDHGRADALPPHARRQHAVGAGHRPRRHRDADRRRAPAAGRRPEPPRPRPQELRRRRSGTGRKQRLDHHAADAPHGRLGRLEARVLHDGRAALGRRHRHLRLALRRGPDLPRQAAGQLGPGAALGGLRPRGRERGARRHHVAHPLPVQRRPAARRDGADARHAHRDDAARDDARPTARSRCIPKTSATGTWSASRSTCRCATGGSRSSPTTSSTASSARAASRSPARTTSTTTPARCATACR